MDPDQMSERWIGTPVYMSPEQVNLKPYNSKADIWALGVLTYVMLTSEMPFTSYFHKKGAFIPKQLKEAITNKSPDYNRFEKFANKGKDAIAFVERCLTKSAEGRASANDLLNDPWITKNNKDEAMDDEQRINVGLNFYTYKNSTLF